MTDNKDAVLSVRGLKVDFTTPDGDVNAVKGIDLDVLPGETLAVVSLSAHQVRPLGEREIAQARAVEQAAQ